MHPVASLGVTSSASSGANARQAEPRRIAATDTPDGRRRNRKIDDRRRLEMTGSTVDDEIECMLVLSADRDWIVQRLVPARWDQRRGQQGLCQARGAGPYPSVHGE